MRQKTVLDTNIILRDYQNIFEFQDTELILPAKVLEELDQKNKHSKDRSVSYNARAFCRFLKKMIKEQDKIEDIELPNNCTLSIYTPDRKRLDEIIEEKQLEPNKPDSEIVATAEMIRSENEDVSTRLVTNDTNMYVTAYNAKLQVDDFISSDKKTSGVYTGVKVIVTEDAEFFASLFSLEATYIREDNHPGLSIHEILVIKLKEGEEVQDGSVQVIFQGYKNPVKRILTGGYQQMGAGDNIRARNKEQGFAFELLKREIKIPTPKGEIKQKIPCITLSGRAGTGKSIVALSYAVDQVINQQNFKKIMILKPTVAVGKEQGFLPGDLDEKLAPWKSSFSDTFDIIFNSGPEDEFTKDDQTTKNDPIAYILGDGKLDFQPLTYMRGRSLQDTLVILDEAQNTSTHEMKTLITRIGENSQIIALGDIEQIDAPYLDKQNNGLYHLIQRGRNSNLVAHITLIKSLRSTLADWAGENL